MTNADPRMAEESDIQAITRWINLWLLALVSAALIGCGRENATEQPTAAPPPRRETANRAKEVPSKASGPKRKFQPVELGDGGSGPAAKPAEKVKVAVEKQSQSIIAALQPFQVLLGQWRW